MEQVYKRKEYAAEDFEWTQWKGSDFQEQFDKALQKSRTLAETIRQVPHEQRTFDNTIFALQMMYAELSGVLLKLELLLNVSPDKAVRDSAQAAVEKFQQTILEFDFDEELYRAVSEYAAKTEELSAEDRRLLDDTLRGYRRKGFVKDTSVRETIRAHSQKIQELGLEFDKVLGEWDDHLLLAPNETLGLPESYLTGLSKDEAGNFIVTLKYPDYFPFVENSANADKRKELIDKFFQRGGQRNLDILEEMIKLRKEIAQLLDYPSYPDYVLEEKVAKNSATVKAFLDDLAAQLKSPVSADLELLTLYKREDVGDPQAKLEYYDVSYYSNEIKKKKYALDKQKIQEYFPVEKVLAGMMEIYSTIFSIKYQKLAGIPVWHPDVDVYSVRNTDGSLVAYFLLDLHPRDGKYGHAAEFGTVLGHVANKSGSEYITPVASMVANFTKPQPGRPSLLTHDEVETLFHEFGHVMHENLSAVKNFAQAGTTVARDFVEAPSQMLEHWVWDRDMLKRLSAHYETGEPLPDELIDTMLGAKHHMDGYFYMRQLVLGMFDFRLHFEDHTGQIVSLYSELVETLLGTGLMPDHRWPAGFAHIAGHGYDVGYYGYLWSKVYGDDMFSRFAAEGLLNSKTGMDYRQKVLAVGASRDEMESVKDFLGREPNNKAFLAELGLS